MYPGESIIEVGGYPALVRFEPGRAGSSLVVFITGGGVLARIAYGHPGGRACDFLAYWLHQEGFASLALSYPMGNAVFDRAYPDFSVVDWGEQSAEIIALHVKAHELPRRVIVMGWSMAGRIVEPITAALHQRDIEVELFVAMAASTPLPNLLPALSAMRPAASGLASVAGAYAEVLLANLQEQSRDAGHVILDPVIFSTQFMGDYPVRLSASAMRYNNGTFIPDPLGDQHQTGAWRYSALPPLALMTHEAKLDARHALMDRATWGFYITQSSVRGPCPRTGNKPLGARAREVDTDQRPHSCGARPFDDDHAWKPHVLRRREGSAVYGRGARGASHTHGRADRGARRGDAALAAASNWAISDAAAGVMRSPRERVAEEDGSRTHLRPSDGPTRI